jgi:hypothetical protein
MASGCCRRYAKEGRKGANSEPRSGERKEDRSEETAGQTADQFCLSEGLQGPILGTLHRSSTHQWRPPKCQRGRLVVGDETGMASQGTLRASVTSVGQRPAARPSSANDQPVFSSVSLLYLSSGRAITPSHVSLSGLLVTSPAKQTTITLMILRVWGDSWQGLACSYSYHEQSISHLLSSLQKCSRSSLCRPT